MRDFFERSIWKKSADNKKLAKLTRIRPLVKRAYQKILWIGVLVFNVPPTAKVIWRRGHGLVSSDRLEKPGIEPATPGLQGKWLIHYITAAPKMLWVLKRTGFFEHKKQC